MSALGVTKGKPLDVHYSKTYIEIYKNGVFQDNDDSGKVSGSYSYAVVKVTNQHTNYSAKTNHKIWDAYGEPKAEISKASSTAKLAANEGKMSQLRSEQENNKLNDSWEELKTEFMVTDNEWKAYDYFDTDLITQQMNEKEATSFNDTVLEAITDVREKGDLVPVVLVNKELNVAKILFEREEGKGEKIEITLEKNGETWAVNGVEKQ
ncbi:hypothetical protein [Brevibacillus reuszeri]|uniref:hypothetical protein n=1 Tax=Brevibacillus reuszeri TaxID=54915 RepID=UPI000CCBE0CA|nr:hypothetical protein [Brevibacillus reuszeri]